jgi:rubrerythrin
MKNIISVSKTYIHRGRHKHKPSTKKQWFVYYYDENGKFHSEKISYLQAMYYKQQKLRRLKYYCENCGKFFLGLVKSPKQQVVCPNCGDLE